MDFGTSQGSVAVEDGRVLGPSDSTRSAGFLFLFLRIFWLGYKSQETICVVSKKKKKKIGLQGACLLALGSLGKTHARRDVETELRPGVPRMGL